MVFFTCNHCGESVKKPAVAKHYDFKCRGAPKAVSCMDCQKDFHGEDYVAHTRCITEAEKYSGKDFVPKDPKNSGQKKQEGWMEIIRSILDTKEYNLSKQTRASFQTLQNVDNVPRKKAKFQNFASNCMRMRKDQAEEVWSVLEKELEKMKASKLQSNQSNGEAKDSKIPEEIKQTTGTGAEQNAENEVEEQSERKRVKKSKKRKIDKEIQNTIEQDEEKEILQMITDMTGKGGSKNGEPSKKKSKKSKDSVAKQENVNAEQEPTISTTTPGPDEFLWGPVMICTVRKYGDSMKLEKLKKKVLRMYITKKEVTALTEKHQNKFDKKFVKYLKKCNFKMENNVVSLSPQSASDN